MKRLIFFFGALGAGGVMFSFLIAGVGWEEVWTSLSALSFSHALLILFLTAGFFSVATFRWHVVLQSQGCSLSFLDTWKTYLAGISLWFFLPMFPFANELFRASSLSEQKGIAISKAMASVFIDRILDISSNVLAILAGGVVFLLWGEHISYSAKTIAVGTFVGAWILLLLFLYLRLFRKKSIVRVFWRNNSYMEETEKEIFRFFRLRNSFLWKGVALSLGKGLVGIGRALAIIVFLGKGFAFLPAITAHGFYYLALLVPIPGALGSQEALQATAFGALGLGAGTGAAFALLVRAAELLFAIAGLFLVFPFGFSLLKNTVLHKGEYSFRTLSHDK